MAEKGIPGAQKVSLFIATRYVTYLNGHFGFDDDPNTSSTYNQISGRVLPIISERIQGRAIRRGRRRCLRMERWNNAGVLILQ